MIDIKLKHILIFSLVGLMATALYSCYKTDIQFGTQFVDNQYTQVIQVDTLHPQVSTVYIDSFATSGTNVGLIGQYNDPQFGVISASSYFQLGVPSYSASSTEYNFATYDSVALYVRINKGLFYGDTTQPFQMNVFQLNNIITPPLNSSVLYNTSSVAASSTPLAGTSVMIKPNSVDSLGDTLSIRLPDALGQTLFSMLQNGDVNIQTNDQFVAYFKGLKLSVSGSTGMAISIKDSIQMRVYYRVPGLPQAVEKYATFGLYNNSLQFNQISVNRTGALQQAGISSDNKVINSSLTNNSGFLQPFAGAMVKISFPSIRSLLQQPSYVKILKATLTVRPLIGTYEQVWSLPSGLGLSQTDFNNGYGAYLTYASGNTQTGSLQPGNINGVGAYYTYDLTAYLQSLITNPSAITNGNGLLLVPVVSPYSNYCRTVIGDAYNTTSPMQLVIDYLSVK